MIAFSIKLVKNRQEIFDYILHKKSSPEWNGTIHRHELPATFIKLILLVSRSSDSCR